MLAHAHTGAVHGIDALMVRTEVNISSGLPAFNVVGLAQGSVREGRERVAAALRNSGFALPLRRITVNLSPADVRKEGTAFDLPIAVAILAAAGHLPASALSGIVLLGELGLDGALRRVPGVLSVATRARDHGLKGLIVPSGNAAEAGVVKGLEVFGADDLGAVVEHLRGGQGLGSLTLDPGAFLESASRSGPDLSDIKGQAMAKRVLEIVAAGSHNVLMTGPPGSGKTMLARCVPGILPRLEVGEAMEVTRVHSVAGLLGDGPLVNRRPFRAPHHSVSYAGLVGGGTPLRPGEISLAHHGVLFLDELPEFRRSVLEVLRQPLEEGSVTLCRARGSAVFPARFLLVAAMNPCPCGYRGDGSDRCLCDSSALARYRGRVSGPLTDRIDLHVEVPAVSIEELHDSSAGESSADVAHRVRRARRIQTERLAGVTGRYANAHLTTQDLRRWCGRSRAVTALLHRAVERAGLSARGHDRLLRVARTIADLAGESEIREEHAAEALHYRALDRAPGRCVTRR
ncbi:MAG: YifB family Mg chelatase-like AAA ATPase [Gemmatimonadetes bacterium]|nr:YifB family Mg chelatase-like AAA ATPase [Gemmatimonadota bacterium]MDA1104068.1 YifB family Mg chelatase-like AAA ATPase [Gemmatimonadota bacterium]